MGVRGGRRSTSRVSNRSDDLSSGVDLCDGIVAQYADLQFHEESEWEKQEENIGGREQRIE